MKKLPVYWQGKKLRDVYPHASRFQVFKYRTGMFLTRLFKWTLVSSMIAGSIFASYKMGEQAAPEKITMAYQEKLVNSLPEKIESLKSKVIEDLKSCESKGYKETDGIIILDSNNKMSIGLLQFQKKTVTHYYKELYQKDISLKEAVEIALDEKKASELAKDIIFKTDKGLTNWITCSKKHNLVERVKVIKELEQ